VKKYEILEAKVRVFTHRSVKIFFNLNH